MKMRGALVFFSASAAAVCSAATQLCVAVRDPAGLPVPRAEVVIEPQAAAAILWGVTGADGRFCQSVSPGQYALRIFHEKLLGSAAAVQVAGQDRAVEREFVLQIASVASQVQVTASRLPDTLLEAPTPVRQLDRGQMEKLGARHLNDALQEQPEVVTFAGGSHAHGGSANVQGFTSRSVEVLVDGQPLVGRVGGYIDLAQIDSSVVEAVEIKTGASAMTYGLQGLGGAINLITRRASEGANASLETGYGSFNTAIERADAGVAARGWTALLAASTQRSLGYDLDPSTAVKTQSANRTRNLFGSFYAPQWKNVGTGLTALWMEQTYWGFDQSATNAIYDFNRPKKRLVLVPRASVALNGENLLSLRARHLFYRSAEDIAYRSPGSLSAVVTTQTANGGEAEWTMARSSGFRSAAGLFFNRQDIKGSSLGTPDGNASRDNWSQLASVEFPLGKVLKLQGGYRFDHDSVFGDRISPQAIAAWRVRDGLSVSASITRGLRAPDFGELYLNNTHAGGRVRVLGNPALKPEQSWSTAAGVLFSPAGNVRLEGRLFDHRLEDMILSRLAGKEGTASVYRYRNVGAARIRGGMVSAEANIGRRLEVAGSYQYLHTRDLTAGIPLEYSPRQRASVRATWSSRPLGLLVSAFGNATGRTFFGATSNIPDYMRAFELCGVNMQKEIHRNLTFRVAFRNLTGNVDPDYRFTAPFSVEASMRIRIGASR